MKVERDELTLRIFPALRKICEERGIAWGEVDLRWGIPEEKKGEVLSTCLKFIDECRPYFIGMLGERYGWVDETAPEGVIKDYSWIEDHKGKSITELEILHGVLNNPAMAGHVYFYFRDPAYVDTLSSGQRAEFLEGPTPEDVAKYGADEAERRAEKLRGQLTVLKEKIRRSGVPVREKYRDPVQFGELVKEDLRGVIDDIAPPPAPLTEDERTSAALDREDMAHEAFAASRFGVYIQRQAYFDRLDAHATGNCLPIAVLGESGSGKSALLAHWAFRYRSKHPDTLVLVHFIGASSESTDWASMLRRFLGEFKRKFLFTEEIPEQEVELMAVFRKWLSMAAAQGRVVLVIDALNQLEDRNGAPDLVWLPPKIPDNIQLIVSTLPGRPLDAVRKRRWPALDVEPLTVSERNALITCYLKKYRRELDAPVRAELAMAKQTQNPLFLRAVLEELRVHGTFGELDKQIRIYLAAQTVDTLFEMILARYEQDYERDRPGLVKDTVSFLWAARRGLFKAELMDLMGNEGRPLADAYWAPLFLALEHSLIEKDGRITFFHDYIRVAVEHRYFQIEEAKRQAHLRIANYFAKQLEGFRKIEELPWQLAEAGEWDRLVNLLTNLPFFLAAWENNEYDVKRYWVKIETKSTHKIVTAYRPIIETPEDVAISFIWSLLRLLIDTGHPHEASIMGDYLIYSSRSKEDFERLGTALNYQATILKNLGNIKEALSLKREEERIWRELEKYFALAVSLGNHALLLQDCGEYCEAMDLFEEQRQLCIKIGDIDLMATCTINQASILIIIGELDRAMDLLEKTELIFREHGNMSGLIKNLVNQALIQSKWGNLDKALTIIQEQEQICRDLGDMDGLQITLNNRALIQRTRGDLAGAIVLFREQEMICRDSGNLQGLQLSLGGQASVLEAQGDLDGAMSFFKEQEKICRESENPNGLQLSLGGQASILKDRGDLNGALDLIKEQEKICRTLMNANSLQICLNNQATLLYTQHNLDKAMELLKEQEQISRKLPNPDGLAGGLGNQALIHQARGDTERAMLILYEVEKIYRRIGNQLGLARCLGNQANILQSNGNLIKAYSIQKEVEQICRLLNNINCLAICLVNQAIILSHQNRHWEALSTAKQAYRLATGIGYTSLAKQISQLIEGMERI
jgi:tetratricopeptide (TPR) repeat protein